MNDMIFANSFVFRTIIHNKYHYTDNRAGTSIHYFAYMLSGNCKICVGSEEIEIHKGDFFYIPKQCSYQSFWYGNPEIKFISLGFPFLPNSDNKVYPVQIVPYIDKAAELFHKLENKTHVSADDIGLLYSLAGTLLPLMSNKPLCRSKEIVENTEKYLTLHPFAKPSELSKNCAISEAALYAAFKKSSDITLNQLRNNLLLEKSKDIIITTDKPIEYISDCLKFSSASYFRKKFKQYFNMTPKEMRKKYRI